MEMIIKNVWRHDTKVQRAMGHWREGSTAQLEYIRRQEAASGTTGGKARQTKAGDDNNRQDRLGGRTAEGTTTVTTVVKQGGNSRSTQIIIPSLTNKTSQPGPLPTCRIRRTQIMRFANAPVRFSPFCSRLIRELETVRLKLSPR